MTVVAAGDGKETVTMTRAINLHGARGGQGTTTIAAALALFAGESGQTTLACDAPTATAPCWASPPPSATTGRRSPPPSARSIRPTAGQPRRVARHPYPIEKHVSNPTSPPGIDAAYPPDGEGVLRPSRSLPRCLDESHTFLWTRSSHRSRGRSSGTVQGGAMGA
jgi:hypothetical protein